jgi:hypothetical protein
VKKTLQRAGRGLALSVGLYRELAASALTLIRRR